MLEILVTYLLLTTTLQNDSHTATLEVGGIVTTLEDEGGTSEVMLNVISKRILDLPGA